MNTTELYEKDMFDFLDDEFPSQFAEPTATPEGSLGDEERETRNRFVVDSDDKANWALEKIRFERNRRDRRVTQAKAKIDYYEGKIKDFTEECERNTSYFLGELGRYFEMTDPKNRKVAKTQEKYELVDGDLVKKYGKIDYKYEDKNLIDYLKANAPDLVTVKETPQWGNFKKRTKLTPDGEVIDTETGEVLGFIKAARQPDTFEVNVGNRK